MATPILTPALIRLRAGFSKSFPRRSTASDGWIGDLAHSQGTSGHNPDDTPGVSAERSDSDSIPEVRAIDVDVDLVPGDRAASRLAMLRQIHRIIATPEDRRRLIYIIFDGTIWSASRGWDPATYQGENKHREHAHYSGHPDYDNDGRAWSVETGDGMALDTDEIKYLAYASRDAEALRMGNDSITGDENVSPQAHWAVRQLKAMGTAVSVARSSADAAKTEAALAKDAAGQAGIAVGRVEGKVDELLARPPVVIDYRLLADALLEAVLTRETEGPS